VIGLQGRSYGLVSGRDNSQSMQDCFARHLRFAVIWLLVTCTLGGICVASTAAEAATFGSNLGAGANESLCRFQSLEPETRSCTIEQVDLLSSHSPTDGLVAPFDGVIVRWSVVTGTPLSGTGAVKLALRSLPPGFLERGPEVELPLSSPGTRHTFLERMPVTAGQYVGLRIWITNHSTQEAGAPIAFRQDGVGTIRNWAGEPYESASEGLEGGVELLMEAEIEPDGDHDGYGDLTQDCSPNEIGSDQRCDFKAPAIRLRSVRRQPFLKTGVISIHASLNETGFASAAGRLLVMGKRGRWTSSLRNPDSRLVEAGGWAALRLRVPKRALKAARVAAQRGKEILAKVNIRVVDTRGNERRELVEVDSR
jgi:hypothetical protein